MESVLRCYEALSYPSLARFALTRRPSSAQNVFVAESHWSVPSPKADATLRSTRQHFIAPSLDCLSSAATPASADVKRVCYAPSGALRAVVRDVSKSGSPKPTNFLEIWSDVSGRMEAAFDLTARKVHGPIYDDNRFGGMTFSGDEKRIFYIAERQKEEGISYFSDAKADEKTDSKKGISPIFKQSWGEQLAEKCESVLAVANVPTGLVEVVPETVFGDPALCPAEFVLCSDRNAIVGVVYDTKPFKLGAQFCLNRKTRLYILPLKFHFDGKLDVEDLKVEWVENLDDLAVWNLRLTPDEKRLVFLAAEPGGPHVKTASLRVLDLESREVSTVVPVCRTLDESVRFAGLYGGSCLPRKCFLRDGEKTVVAFTSAYMHCAHIYAVDLDGENRGKVRRLTDCPSSAPAGHGSWFVQEADWETGLLLASWSDSSTPVELCAANYRPGSGALEWKRLGERGPRRPEALEKAEILRLYPIENKDHGGDAVVGSNAILILPGNAEPKSVPMVVIPHGGPHSVHLDEYLLGTGLFVSKGIAVLKVNYRGSLGSGEDFVNALLGKVGFLDVSDCHAAVQAALQTSDKLDPKKIALYGGSHGGFLVTHLAGQYPETYKCVVALNPVTNLAAMAPVTDIPDWTYVEAGLPYRQTVDPLSAEQFSAMMKMSPVAHVNSIRCPVLLQIGDKDLRVPPSQGYSLYYMLKARGVPVELRRYEDNHALSKPDISPGVTVSTVLWIMDQLGVSA